MSIYQLNFSGKDKVEVAIERFKAFEPPEGYYLAFSGGKDSIVTKALADMSGVKYDAHYNVTSVDPPELIKFIREKHPDVIFEYPKDKDGNRITMWNLIPKKQMPPTRLMRYCCRVLKEGGGDGRFTVTGVRWAESRGRRENQGEVTIYSADEEMRDNPDFIQTNRGGVVLTNDNEESRKLIDSCYKRRKTVLNPIIDWTDAEVWEFIKDYKIPYCSLYDEGFKRLGCIGCPMGTNQLLEFERYPKYKKAYISAFDRMIKAREEKGKTTRWKNGEEVFAWWGGESFKVNKLKEK